MNRPYLAAAGAFCVPRVNARAAIALVVSVFAQVDRSKMDKRAKVWRSSRVAEVCFQ